MKRKNQTPRSKLNLKREAIRRLDVATLNAVVGGASADCGTAMSRFFPCPI